MLAEITEKSQQGLAFSGFAVTCHLCFFNNCRCEANGDLCRADCPQNRPDHWTTSRRFTCASGKTVPCLRHAILERIPFLFTILYRCRIRTVLRYLWTFHHQRGLINVISLRSNWLIFVLLRHCLQNAEKESAH